MASYPRLKIHLGKIERNARVMEETCAAAGLSLTAVTKVTGGHPDIAAAVLRGGVTRLADSRLDNLERLKWAFPEVPLMLLRLPAPSEAARVVELADVSLNSEPSVLGALSRAAVAAGKKHHVILMVELGDLREGLLPRDLSGAVEHTLYLPGIELEGLGTNLACFGGIQPSPENLGVLASLAEDIRRRFDTSLPVVSGGNTFTLPLVADGRLPAGINHLRVGAGIMLGSWPTPPSLLERLAVDAFVLEAEILECRVKPSRPWGAVGENAFGELPDFDEGDRPMNRALLALGRQDTKHEGLTPLDPGVRVLGASSDHTIVEAGPPGSHRPGDVLSFLPDYGALLGLMTSPYVRKEFLREDVPDAAGRRAGSPS